MYQLILSILGRSVEVFYRFRRLGRDIPKTGPLIIVANHPNGLIDPVIVAYLAGREVRFLAKEPLFRTPLIGWVARTLKALPVYRKMDGHDTDANEKTFQAVYDALGNGQAICLFPEGISHEESQLAPFKTGPARLALAAGAHGPDSDSR